MIRIEEVSKEYQRGTQVVRALNDVSLEVQPGEFLSIMGPSGSGKSTLLHLAGGLDMPSSGEVYFEGRALSVMKDREISELRRNRIGFVFQFFNLLPTLTAEENVALPLLLGNRRDVDTDVDRVLAMVGLSGRKRHKPDQLSGGEMQRVGIARALVCNPALLLADEPTGNLDSKTGEEILTLLRETNQELNLTVIMVTHDPKAAAYGDRIITLRDGRIAEDLKVGNGHA